MVVWAKTKLFLSASTSGLREIPSDCMTFLAEMFVSHLDFQNATCWEKKELAFVVLCGAFEQCFMLLLCFTLLVWPGFLLPALMGSPPAHQ